MVANSSPLSSLRVVAAISIFTTLCSFVDISGAQIYWDVNDILSRCRPGRCRPNRINNGIYYKPVPPRYVPSWLSDKDLDYHTPPFDYEDNDPPVHLPKRWLDGGNLLDIYDPYYEPLYPTPRQPKSRVPLPTSRPKARPKPRPKPTSKRKPQGTINREPLQRSPKKPNHKPTKRPPNKPHLQTTEPPFDDKIAVEPDIIDVPDEPVVPERTTPRPPNDNNDSTSVQDPNRPSHLTFRPRNKTESGGELGKENLDADVSEKPTTKEGTTKRPKSKKKNKKNTTTGKPE